MEFVKSHPIAVTAGGAFLFYILLGSAIFGGLAFPLLLVVWAGCGLVWWQGRTGSGSPSGEAGRLTMLKEFGSPETKEAPAFLTADAWIFKGDYTIHYRGRSGQMFSWHGAALKPHSPHDVMLAGSCLYWSAVAERERRGFAVRDEAGQLQQLYYDDNGWMIERIENADGSVDDIYAYDFKTSLDPEDYLRAYKLDLEPYREPWKKAKPAKHETDKNPGAAPLFYPVLKKVRVRDAWISDNPFQPRSVEHGSAQFAWFDELQQSPSITVPHEGMHRTVALLGGLQASHWVENDDRNLVVCMKGEGHRIVVGPPGSGKFTSVIAPLLLSTDDASIFVFDVANGEAARVTGGHRAKLGPMVVLDPFGVSGFESGGLNPLDFLNANDPDLLHAARSLTDALFIASGGGENAEYFNAQAKDVLTAYLLHVATGTTETDRTLRRVRELIRRPITADLLSAMSDNPIAGGMVADTAANLIEAIKTDAEKNTFFVTQTLRANTAFLDLPAVLRATERTTFDPAILRQRVSTLYVCLPEQQLAQVGRWLRLVYSSIMERVRVKTDIPLHVAIDEFPALGPFTRVKDDMALVRKFGIHMHIATQSLTQLEAIYDKDWQSFMASAKYQQLLGVNDHMTGEYFSRRLGTTTRRSTSANQSRSSGGGSQGSNSGWMADDLMSPDELGRLHPSEVIIAVEGMNPLRLQKGHYFEIPLLSDRANLAPEGDFKTA